MPVRPQVKNLTATSADIFNSVRNGLGEHFKSVVPMASADMGNSRDIGSVILSNPELSNAFLSALVNRIGRVILSSKEYTNPWEGFKKGLMEYGETIEEIFVNIAEPHNYDPISAEETVFKRTIPDVKSAFHTMNYQKHYDTTVQDEDLRQAFLSSEGISDLIAKIIDALYTGANFDEFITMKYLIARQALKGNIKPTIIPNVDATNAKTIVSTIKGVSNSLEFLKDEYNVAQVLQTSKKDDQFLIMNSEFDAVIDVEVLASSFNMDKAQFMGHRVPVDSFSFNKKELQRLDLLFADDRNYQPITTEENTLLKTIPSVLVDREWFMVFDNLNRMTEQFNGKGMYWNYWYHVWKTFSISPFANATMFTTTSTTITGVTAIPNIASLPKGGMIQMHSKVDGTGFVPQGVTWEIITAVTDSTTTISPSGYLTIGLNETQTTIEIKVKSIADETKEGTLTITVV